MRPSKLGLVRTVGVGKKNLQKTYNASDSHIVTDCSTSGALQPLSTGVRTGPAGLIELWSYVRDWMLCVDYIHGYASHVWGGDAREAKRITFWVTEWGREHQRAN